MAQRLRFQCCFCGKTIEAKPPDVASLLYTTCVDRARKLQIDQTIFCHTKCLADRLHPSVTMYAVDILRMRRRNSLQDKLDRTRKTGEPKLPEVKRQRRISVK